MTRLESPKKPVAEMPGTSPLKMGWSHFLGHFFVYRPRKVREGMKERPILFNAEMVRAVLDSRKTQTRRVVKIQPTERDLRAGTRGGSFSFGLDGNEWWIQGPLEIGPWKCPYGVPGDRLWVRETWTTVDPIWDGDKPIDISIVEPLLYRATATAARNTFWRPSIHMPRWASRILLEVVSVRVERVQEISEEDAIREGCSYQILTGIMPGMRFNEGPHRSYRHGFMGLWDSINAKREPENGYPYSWGANPWVWVVEFKRLTHD